MDTARAGSRPEKRRLWLSVSVFLVVLFLALSLHRCQNESLPPTSALSLTALSPIAHTGQPSPHDTVPTPIPESTLTSPTPIPSPTKTDPKPIPKPVDTVAQVRHMAPVDSGPYIYADPWGGRHFDSVTVSLHCREGCVLLYSLEDSVHFKSYETPLVFRRNTTLWISAIDSLSRQVAPIRVDYIIERNPGACAGNSMPIEIKGKALCMDTYEWPNKDGEFSRTFVSQKDAADSCRQVGKRLCSQSEWHQGCQGPDGASYPYGNKYNENYCPAKETAGARAGRFPVCRSYYGLYDMTGNLWEWTSTPAPSDPDFYMVVGGNWDIGNEGTCNLAKFSFYPSVRYPFVGFRCCQDILGK
jgi:hypothetical protein